VVFERVHKNGPLSDLMSSFRSLGIPMRKRKILMTSMREDNAGVNIVERTQR